MKRLTLHWYGILLSIGAVALAGCTGSDTEAPHGAGREPALAGDVPGNLAAPTFARHGAGILRASMADGRPVIYCDYRVEREGEGSAAVTITRPDQSLLVVRFSRGEATSVAGGAPTFTSSRNDDLNLIQVGEEQYAIPDHVIYGN